GSVGHVEVFRMVGVGTSIFGRPRRLPPDRRASALYTLICEEPDKDPEAAPGKAKKGKGKKKK
ncbi:hypothetical protein, partial [Ornithinimicrobium sp. LYQ103]|uniref:hypothetical protein n=1 Tax=Ornithinimicrobium sp. LYQ103 TaxID=3378796 RepID=UPI0038540635